MTHRRVNHSRGMKSTCEDKIWLDFLTRSRLEITADLMDSAFPKYLRRHRLSSELFLAAHSAMVKK